MDPLLAAAIRRRELERGEDIETTDPAELQSSAPVCPVCGGRTRSGVRGPCVACRPVRLCACGCERQLDPRDEWPYSKWCGSTALRAMSALATSPEVVQVMRLMRPVIASMKQTLDAKRAAQSAEDSRQLRMFGATGCGDTSP